MMYFEEDCQLGFGMEKASRRIDPLFDGAQPSHVWVNNEYAGGAYHHNTFP